jgi:hypothetical protein
MPFIMPIVAAYGGRPRTPINKVIRVEPPKSGRKYYYKFAGFKNNETKIRFAKMKRPLPFISSYSRKICIETKKMPKIDKRKYRIVSYDVEKKHFGDDIVKLNLTKLKKVM